MRYMIYLDVPPERAQQIESKPEGPGPFMGYIMERFKPECSYNAMTQRAMWMVVDCDEQGICELMLTLSKMSGTNPIFTPVIPTSDFGKVAGPVMEAAAKAPNI
jgi:hypothetical protein